MDQLTQFLNFVERVGVPFAVLIAIAWWLKPRAERWFESQCKMFDSVCERLQQEPEVDKRKLRVIGRVGTMVYEAAPDEKQAKVKAHLEELHRDIESHGK